jgi:hypothetical protein
MKKVMLGILIVLPFYCLSQQNLKTIRTSSWQTLVYSISANEAEQFMKWDSIPVQRFENATPVLIAYTDSLDTDSLPIGHYVQINIIDHHVHAALFNNTDLVVLTVNNQDRVQLDVRRVSGESQPNAKAFFKGKEIPFNNDSKTFWIREHKLEEALIKLCAPGDTTFIQLTETHRSPREISRQIRLNYHFTKIYKLLNWLPKKLKSIFNERYRQHRRVYGEGYIIFNQPKYKPLDTVKFKGYAVDKRWKQYKKSIDVYLNYTNKGRQVDQFLYSLKPLSSGAYTGEFILADTIPVDAACRLYFRTRSKKDIINNRFKVEDYVLDEMGSFNFKADKETYYKNDSIYFTASSKDANGLNVMDATATLVVTVNAIKEFYKDSLFVADTIYSEEKQLLVAGDTKFAFATNNFPSADLSLKATLIFKNSNNELHEEKDMLNFIYSAEDIVVTQDADSIKASFRQNGKDITVAGEMEMNEGKRIKMQFPYKAKIDPVAEYYTFYSTNTNGKEIESEIEIDGKYKLNFGRISHGDTLGFYLMNPYRIPVYFSVLNGKKLIAAGKQSGEIVSWEKVMNDSRQSYTVRWQYIWAGEEFSDEMTLGLLYKLLDIKISGSENVFPGQKDSIKIEVKDFKGAPAANVNLTAVSYNNQFKDIRVTQPPYLAKYHGKHFIERQGFEKDDDFYLTKKYLLGNNMAWVNIFRLDSMLFYKLLFPGKRYFDAVTRIEDLLPQVSVNLVQHGVPQGIYLLYVNRNLAYYSGVTDKANNSYAVYPENVQIGIRLKNKYIEIDSLYMQPFYKHDLSFDIDNLPPHSKIISTGDYWSNDELALLERTMWRMKDSYGNNNAFIWQNRKVIELSGNRQHIAGPFLHAPITFYNPGKFDISFNFESGYEYSLSKQIARLERKDIFPDRLKNNYLPSLEEKFLPLGDTLVDPPFIVYPAEKKKVHLQRSAESYQYSSYTSLTNAMGRLQYPKPKDSTIIYTVLQPVDDRGEPVILESDHDRINNLPPALYNLYLITNHYYVLEVNNIRVRQNGTSCIAINKENFKQENDYINQLMQDQENKLMDAEEKKAPIIGKEYKQPDNINYTRSGYTLITGKVVDGRGGNPVPFATVKVIGSGIGISADATGSFTIRLPKAWDQVLEISGSGYLTIQFKIDTIANINRVFEIVLARNNDLKEVVVSGGYGVKRSLRSTTSNTMIVSADELNSLRVTNIATALQGKVAGIQIRGQSGQLAGPGTIRLRGATSLADSSSLLYVIDGISYKTLPKNFNMDNIAEVSLLNGNAAVAIFGPDAGNGVMIITTKTKTFRKAFRDYAFWQPNFFTGKDGKASFEVTYPDNITGWKTFVVAMDKKRRSGKASVITQSYKPIVSQLSVPQFLITGDTVELIGKAINYTTDQYNISTVFTINDKERHSTQKELNSNGSMIDEQLIIAGSDTIKAAYAIETTTGYKDGEERKIPVFKKGTEEAIGNFWVLQNDTTVNFSTAVDNSELDIYAQNNTLDVLLDEIEHLKQYPYFCMEQIASKLTGYAMEKKIKEQLGQSFKNEKDMNRLLSKLQKAQLFDGGWAWWEKGKPNFYISNYIASALMRFRDNALVETNVRNAFLYLHNQLPGLSNAELLAALTTLSNGKHEMDYTGWLEKIRFDSLTQHQQWQWVQICQQQKLNYQTELKTLVGKKIETQLGGIHWGEENYKWYSNEIATTVIAYTVLQNEPAYKQLLPSIIQYFLSKRKGGYWRNTVESASIMNAVLPEILEQHKGFTAAASLQFSGDSSFTVNTFPYQLHKNNTAVKNLSISKSGGVLIYLTAYQKIFNETPLPVNDKFIVQTSFKKNGEGVSTIRSGEKIKMIITVNVLKDADYVMIEAPIPAGCTYAAKNNSDWTSYKEFYKDKMLLFTESLAKGMHQFEIELEPRYNGTYTLNPAKAELMYYPIFYGRNEMKKIVIAK